VVSDEIRVTLDQLPKNYDLELYAPGGMLMADSRNGGNAPEHIIFPVANEAGQYRVRVFSPTGEYSATMPYRLTIQVIPYTEPTLVVTTTDDVNDGACTAAHCSLREAILAANTGVAGRILFDIPPSDGGFRAGAWWISPTSPLPAITSRAAIDGLSQTVSRGDTNPHGPEIVLDGSVAGSSANGLVFVRTTSSSVTGMAIVNWGQSGIFVDGGTQFRLLGSFVGVDPSGTTAAANQNGIVMEGGHSHRVGGSGAGEGNVISGNQRSGVGLTRTGYAQVYGNRIGTNANGTAALANYDGARLEDTDRARIGGAAAGEGNVISGNGRHGVRIVGEESAYNKVFGNHIGVSADGATALGNRGSGVSLMHGHHNEIGGTDPGRGNTISGNTSHGIHIVSGVLNTVAGNDVGPSGPYLHGNGVHGVFLNAGAEYNTIGPGNTIRRNGQVGISLYDSATVRNTITENSIWSNLGSGISLGSGAHTANDGLLAPLMAHLTGDDLSGSACPGCRVEVFRHDDYQGHTHLATVTALANGRWTTPGIPGTTLVTATATDSRGNTSEFARCRSAGEPNNDFAHAFPWGSAAPIPMAICHVDDTDFYSFEAAAGDLITANLQIPLPYLLRLYGPERTLLASAGGSGDTSLRSITHIVTTSGTHYVEVYHNGASAPQIPYDLDIEIGSLQTRVGVWLDEGSVGAPDVYKLRPDRDGPADLAYVEVVVDASATASEELDVYTTVVIPGDVFAFPEAVLHRSCRHCEAEPADVWNVGPGRYLTILTLQGDATVKRRQAVFRFGASSLTPLGPVQPRVELQLRASGEVVAEDSGPSIHMVDRAPVIIITSRHHLYRTGYDPGQAANLLATVTRAAAGPPGGPVGSRRAAIYFVDDYSDLARNWDNMAWDPANQDTANVATREIDRLLEDWIDDSATTPQIVIVGDDDVIPFFRRRSPCEGKESDNPDSSYPDVLQLLVTNDFILTDNHFADTDHSEWNKGKLEVDVGRIIGDSAWEMERFFQNSLSGPSHGATARAVMASWDGPDLHYASGDEGIIGYVRRWGFSASSDLVDNGDWRANDLLDALRTQFSLLVFADHANPFDWGTPPKGKGKGGVSGSDLSDAISSSRPSSQRPFLGILGCRTAYTLADNSVLDRLARRGFSGMVGSAGISFHSPEGSEWYTEAVMNKFWRRLLPRSLVPREVGPALRQAKRDYSPGWGWQCRNYTAVQQVVLFGVPWLTIPRPEAGEEEAETSSPAAAARPPRMLSQDAFEISWTVDTSAYSIDRDTAPGFDLVEVEGCTQRPFEPLMPGTTIAIPLPPQAQILSVEVLGEDPLALGALDLPIYVPGVALIGNESDEQWLPTPGSVGVVPEAPFSLEVTESESHQVLHLHLAPVVYDAVTRQTTLHRRLALAVSYSAPEPVAVTDVAVTTPRVAPSTPAAVLVEAANVSASDREVSSHCRLADSMGGLVAEREDGPHVLPAGLTTSFEAACPGADEEGSYGLEIEIFREDQLVGSATAVLDVLAGYIGDFFVPEKSFPGAPVTLAITYVNSLSAPVTAAFTVSVHGEGGEVWEELPTATHPVPGSGSLTVEIPWDAAAAPLGTQQVQARVTVNGVSRTAWRSTQVAVPRPVGRRVERP